jgi:hypothetical protein
MNRILKPGPLILILYSVLNILLDLYCLHLLSFSNGGMFGILLFVMLLLLSIILGIVIWIDGKYNTGIVRYVIVSSICLVIAYSLLGYLKPKVENEKMEAGNLVYKDILMYKQQHKHLPDVDYIQHPDIHYYKYEKNLGDTSFYIFFISYGGMSAYRFEGSEEWGYSD